MADSVLLLNAQLPTGERHNIAISEGTIVNPGDTTQTLDRTIDLDGRAVAPAFRDDHLHIMAVARSLTSVDLSPETLREQGGLRSVLQNARSQLRDGWIRGVNYDVAASGPLNREAFRSLGVSGPIRVQDRTGILWMLDDEGWQLLNVAADDIPAGAELAEGAPTGVLRREDVWLRQRLAAVDRSDQHQVRSQHDSALNWQPLRELLPRLGLVALTDAGANNTQAELELLANANLPCALRAMTRDWDVVAQPGVTLGPVKVLLDDHDLPDLDELSDRVHTAHRAGRGVAIHAVTPTQIAFVVNAGIGPSDRIEHGSQIPNGLLDAVVATGATVVMQPGLLWNRGDRYLEQLDAQEHHELIRVHTLMSRGVPVRFSSDAPYGPIDPLIGIRAAVSRTTKSGNVVGENEAIALGHAVEAYAANTAMLSVGTPADLVIMSGTWTEVIAGSASVALTMRNGEIIFGDLGGAFS